MQSKELRFRFFCILRSKRFGMSIASLVNIVAIILNLAELRNIAVAVMSICIFSLLISLRKKKTQFSIIAILFVIFTHLFPISNLLRFSLLSFLLLITLRRKIGNYRTQESVNILQFFYTDVVLLIVTLFMARIEKIPLRIFQFLSFGYDNALHFSLFQVYSTEQEFQFGLNANWTNDFGLFATYPPGYSALWAFIHDNSFGILNSSVGNLLSSFFILNLCLIVIVTLLGADLVLHLSQNTQISKKSICVLIVGPIMYFWGILLTNGFAPYLLGVLVILLHIRYLLESHKDSTNLIITAATGFILISTTPAVVFIVGPSGIYFLYRFLLNRSHRLRFKTIIFFPLAIITIAAYLVYSNTTKTFGWRQMLGPGGVQPPNLVISLVVSIFCLFLLVGIARVRESYLTMLTLFSLGLSVVIYSGITFFLTGSIQYYAIKQAIIFLGLESIFVVAIWLYSQRNRTSSLFNKDLTQSLAIFWLAMFVIGLQSPQIYTGAFMGNVLQTSKAALTQNTWQTEIVDSRQITDVLKLDSGGKNTCLILHLKNREGDLNSRWLNALRESNSITQDCFMAFWNSTNMTLNDMYSQKISGNLDYYIFVDEVGSSTDSKAIPANVKVVMAKSN